MENSLQSFPYKSLAKGTSEIRLIILEPGDFEEPVRSHLQVVKLDHRPDYEALSYVWGSCDDRKSISLNGMEFAVTTNLFIALRYLRRQDKPRTVWIDAVCINQADASERGEQVARMGDIYRQATKVVIWVGEDIMDPTWKGSMCASQIFSHLHDLLYIDDTEDCSQEEPLFDPRDWTRSLVAFVRRPWFSRMWIIQESIAHVDAEIMCGRASMPWLPFLFGVEKSVEAMRLTVHASSMLNEIMSNVMTLQTSLINWYEWKGKSLNTKEIATCLARLLFILGGRFDCSDPRDRLYAIVGLVPGATGALASANLCVDYTRPPADVFRDLAIFLLTERSSLDILAGYGVGPEEWDSDALDGKPSWVPTWGRNPESTIPPILLDRITNETDVNCQSAEFRFSDDKNTLFLRGVTVGEIASLGEEINFQSLLPLKFGQEGVRAWEGRFRRWEQRILQSPALKQKYESSKDARTAWKHALLHGEDDGVLKTQHFCYDVMTGNFDLSTVGEEYRQLLVKEVADFVSFAQYGLVNKLPFVLSTGNIGIAEGVDHLEIGDLVCVFPGATIPFILRPLDDCYIFLGACYMQDFVTQDKLSDFLTGKDITEFALV